MTIDIIALNTPEPKTAWKQFHKETTPK